MRQPSPRSRCLIPSAWAQKGRRISRRLKGAALRDDALSGPAPERDEELARKSIYAEAIALLARRGFDIPADILGRDHGSAWEHSPAGESAWAEIYRDPKEYWDLYELAEKLVDLEYRVQLWRFGHLKTIERIIGFKRGTGGSSGVGYLEHVLKRGFFPELISLRTAI